MKKFFKITCEINGEEEIIRTSNLKKDFVLLTDLEKKLGAKYTELTQLEWLKVKVKKKELDAEFLKPSKDYFFNYESEFETLKSFRKSLDELLDTKIYCLKKQRVFLHTQELNNFIRKNT